MSPRAVIATTSGNTLEWYDFTVYGFLAPLLGRIFFPSADHTASLLSAFAVLAVGYAARPIGSLIYGYIGDKLGRKPALLSSIFIMGLGSLGIACLPTHAQIGLTASMLLIVIRVIQGIAVAGEFTASGVLILEEAAPGRCGFTGAWITSAMMFGCVLGSGVPALVSSLMTQAQLEAWGWRIPFAIGGGVALFGGLLRLSLTESRAFTADTTAPLRDVLRGYWPMLLQMVALLIPTTIIYFLIFVYAASYLTDQMHFSSAQALDISTVNLIVIAVLGLFVGYLSDRVGRRAPMLVGAFGTLVLALPMWRLMHGEDLWLVFLGQFGFAAFSTVGWALSVTILSEMVPARVRCSAVALSYNFCMAIFGGTTPMLATWLVTRTGDSNAPVYYAIFAALISLLAIWKLPRMTQDLPR